MLYVMFCLSVGFFFYTSSSSSSTPSVPAWSNTCVEPHLRGAKPAWSNSKTCLEQRQNLPGATAKPAWSNGKTCLEQVWKTFIF